MTTTPFNYPTSSPGAATRHGYTPVTDDYDLDDKEERALLLSAINQFKGVRIALVKVGDYVTVWRLKSELKLLNQ